MSTGYSDYLIYRSVDRRLVAVQIAIMGHGVAKQKVRSTFDVIKSPHSLVSNYRGVSRNDTNPEVYFPNGEPRPENQLLYSVDLEFTPDDGGELGHQRRLVTVSVDEDLGAEEAWKSLAVTHRGTGFNPPDGKSHCCTSFSVAVTFLFEGARAPTSAEVESGSIRTASMLYASYMK